MVEITPGRRVQDKPYLVALLPFCAVVLVLLTTDVGKWLLPGIKDKSANHPPGTPDLKLVIKVREYLKSRYEHRLRQKLAGRQPVNLRILPSVSGISDESAESLMTLEEEEYPSVQVHLAGPFLVPEFCEKRWYEKIAFQIKTQMAGCSILGFVDRVLQFE